MKNTKIFFTAIIISLSLQIKAQTKSKLEVFQDSLVKISASVASTEEKDRKVAENGRFVKTLVEALKTPNSFRFPFDSLKSVSIIKPLDQSFRILSWYLPFNDGTYRYYGAIQMNTGNGQLKLYPLLDRTEDIKDLNSITSNEKWIGARYYEIIPVKPAGIAPYYILLGWKGNTINSTKKIIEILNLKNEGPVFGAPYFDGKELKNKNRIIFEYNKQNAMVLKSDSKAGMIVYDHLIPVEQSFQGKFEYYVSDGSFDGFKIIGGKLKQQENVELKNNPNANDEHYADPSKRLKADKKF